MPRQLLVIEDGHEYEEFARLFLSQTYAIRAAHSADEALACLESQVADALLVDLRFERAPVDRLRGDLAAMTKRFHGDRARAVQYLKDQQGTLVLAALREAGHDCVAVFVHDFPPRRLTNLRKLYGQVEAVPSFDARLIAEALAR